MLEHGPDVPYIEADIVWEIRQDGEVAVLPDVSPNTDVVVVNPADAGDALDLGGVSRGDVGPVDVSPDDVFFDSGSNVQGSWQSPFEIEALPFAHGHTTASGSVSLADSYSPCAPTIDESGPEVVYRFTTDTVGMLEVSVDDVSFDAIDVDVHLLNAPDPAHCLARDNLGFVYQINPGTYWIVVDTWVNSSGEVQWGPYHLKVSWAESTTSDCLVSGIVCDEDDLPLVNPVPMLGSGEDGCPSGMVMVEDFCVDRYEAALVEMVGGGVLQPWSPYAHPVDVVVMAVSAPDLVPQGYITQWQAEEACVLAGKRLCTNEEWLSACRGPETNLYPYGPEWVDGACNDHRACHPVVQYFESAADWIWSELGHPCINQLSGGLASGGEYGGCVTDEGIHDMVGNLHEWTSDPSGTFRGGFYVDTVLNGPGCLYATTAHNIYHWDYSTGFRCCADL